MICEFHRVNASKNFFITPHAAMRALERGVTIEMIGFCLRTGKRTLLWPKNVFKYSAKLKPGGRVNVLLDGNEERIITVYRTKLHSHKKS